MLCFSCLFVLHLGIYNATVAIVVIDIVAIRSCEDIHITARPRLDVMLLSERVFPWKDLGLWVETLLT